MFTVYIIGHILAYISSQVIEKLSDRVLGKVSTSILVTTSIEPSDRNDKLRKIIKDRINNIKKDKAIIPTIVRASFHIPYIPAYLVIYWFGFFGYYNTRITTSVIEASKEKFKKIGLKNIEISATSQWYKPIEYCVINQCPIATARMYNYLIISGLFRTLSLIFMFASLMQVYYLIHMWIDCDTLLSPILNKSSSTSLYIEALITQIIYLFCLFSYIKFQRRYIEETLFAFVFSVTEIKEPKVRNP